MLMSAGNGKILLKNSRRAAAFSHVCKLYKSDLNEMEKICAAIAVLYAAWPVA